MNCGSCSAVCEINNTGICLGCQRGFVNLPQEDAWVNSEEREKVKMKERKKEIETELATPTHKKQKFPHSKRKEARHWGNVPIDLDIESLGGDG